MVESLKAAGPLLLLATAFFLLAGLAKAAVDIMSHQPDNNIFIRWGGWFDNRVSWKRKYRNYDAGDLRPRFPGSLTWLVACVDFWHFADAIYLKAYLAGGVCGGIAAYRSGGGWAYVALAAYASIVLGAIFELTYKRVYRINRAAG